MNENINSRNKRSTSLSIKKDTSPTLPINIPTNCGNNNKKEKDKSFSLLRFLTPRGKSKEMLSTSVNSNHSPNMLRKEKSTNGLLEEKFMEKDRKKNFMVRTKSVSNKKKMQETFEISAPLNYTRAFYVSENLTWEFKDNNDLQLVLKLGQGGFGTVFKAVHKFSKFVVAVKVIKKENGEITNKDMVEKEMDVLKQCQHENLVQYYGFTITDNEIWLITKFFENGSVYDIMNTLESPLSEKQIATIIKDVINGLEYLHNKGFIHRDIKSANILLDSLGNAALADFGSAFNKEVSSSVGGGTLAFLAPETVEQSLFSEKSDIYALGITCIEMAEKNPPNAELSPQQLAIKIITEDSPTLKNNREFSIHFNDFISSCLEKDYDKRLGLKGIKEKSYLSFALPPQETLFPMLSVYSNIKQNSSSN